MTRQKAREPRCSSFQEFKRRYFPTSEREDWAKASDPRVFGVSLAKESVNKVRNLLCPKPGSKAI